MSIRKWLFYPIFTSDAHYLAGRLREAIGYFQEVLAAAPKLGDAVRSFVGKESLFGIRPEDLTVAEKAAEGETFSAKVEVVEPLGEDLDMAGLVERLGREEPLARGR